MKLRYFYALVLAGCSAAAHAEYMLGNPAVIGTPGQFEILVGGGQSEKLNLDSKATTATLSFGTVSGPSPVIAKTPEIGDDQVFIGASYVLNKRAQFFASIGSGKKTGWQSTSRSRSIGVKISPDTGDSFMRMGLILRAQQVSMDVGSIRWNGFGPLSDGINNFNYTSSSLVPLPPLTRNEQFKYTRYDVFFGASTSTGIIRPYGGLCLTSISGTDSISVSGQGNIHITPVGGGAGTYSILPVMFNSKSDISASKNITGVLGISFNPDSELSMTAEYQSGLQDSIAISGSIKF